MRIAIAGSRVRQAGVALMAALACLLSVNVGTGSAATSSSYPNVVFSDGFESGSLSGAAMQPMAISACAYCSEEQSRRVRISERTAQRQL